jgi:hypothetical protein
VPSHARALAFVTASRRALAALVVYFVVRLSLFDRGAVPACLAGASCSLLVHFARPGQAGRNGNVKPAGKQGTCATAQERKTPRPRKTWRETKATHER